MSLSSTISLTQSPTIAAMALYRMTNGEYSAGSVATNPIDADKLNLVRLKDGNYGSPLFATVSNATVPNASAAGTSSSGILAALSNLVLGG